jgi:hypothetical protein
MPHRRRNAVAPVAALQKDRLPRHPMDGAGGRTTDCGVPGCSGQADPDSPAPLCGKHVREVWQYAQGVIADRLLIAATSLIE